MLTSSASLTSDERRQNLDTFQKAMALSDDHADRAAVEAKDGHLEAASFLMAASTRQAVVALAALLANRS